MIHFPNNNSNATFMWRNCYGFSTSSKKPKLPTKEGRKEGRRCVLTARGRDYFVGRERRAAQLHNARGGSQSYKSFRGSINVRITNKYCMYQLSVWSYNCTYKVKRSQRPKELKRKRKRKKRDKLGLLS